MSDIDAAWTAVWKYGARYGVGSPAAYFFALGVPIPACPIEARAAIDEWSNQDAVPTRQSPMFGDELNGPRRVRGYE